MEEENKEKDRAEEQRKKDEEEIKKTWERMKKALYRGKIAHAASAAADTLFFIDPDPGSWTPDLDGMNGGRDV